MSGRRRGFFALQTARPGYNGGFMIVELLVAMAVFLFLGVMLVSVFRTGMGLWNTAEARKAVFRRVQTALAVIREDLSALAMRDGSREDNVEVDVRMAADLVTDANGTTEVQRVRFVRTIGREMRNDIMRDAGTYDFIDADGTPVPLAPYDQIDDAAELASGRTDADFNPMVPSAARRLGAPAGLMEVGYLMNNETLYRAVKAPVGFIRDTGQRESLFGKDLFTFSTLETTAQALVDHVLYFEILFWGPDTTAWNISDPRVAQESSLTWDSTRVEQSAQTGYNASIDEDIPSPFDDPAAQTGDAADDIYPAKVKVTIVLDSDRRTRVLTRVTNDGGGTVTCGMTRGFVRNAPDRQYAKIGAEWVQYADADGTAFTGVVRGRRHTKDAAPHAAGTEVYQGFTFTTVIDIAGVANK